MTAGPSTFRKDPMIDFTLTQVACLAASLWFIRHLVKLYVVPSDLDNIRGPKGKSLLTGNARFES